MTDGMSGTDGTKDRVQSESAGEKNLCDDSGPFHFDVGLKFTVRTDEQLLSYIMGLLFFKGGQRLFY